VQFRFHAWALFFWVMNVPAAMVLLAFFPNQWTKFAVFYVLLLSLYANADTDYDAPSASLAAMHAEALLRTVQERKDRPGWGTAPPTGATAPGVLPTAPISHLSSSPLGAPR
jgi:hypothetical protein